MKRLVLGLVFCVPCAAQVSNPAAIFVSSAPPSSCIAPQPLKIVAGTGQAYTCFSGVSTELSAGTGVTSITWSLPSFMSASPATISAAGTQIFSFTTTGTAGAVVLSGTPTILTPVLNGTATGTGVSQTGGTGTLAQRNSANNLLSANFLSTGTPTIAAGTGAGTTPTLTITGTDSDGIINLTTGTSPVNAATIFTVTRSNPCPTGTAPIIRSANANAAGLSGNSHEYVTPISTTQWSTTSNQTGLAQNTAYQWTYHVGCY